MGQINEHSDSDSDSVTYQLPRECGIDGDSVGRCLVRRTPDNTTMRHQIPCPAFTPSEHNIMSIRILSIGMGAYVC